MKRDTSRCWARRVVIIILWHSIRRNQVRERLQLGTVRSPRDRHCAFKQFGLYYSATLNGAGSGDEVCTRVRSRVEGYTLHILLHPMKIAHRSFHQALYDNWGTSRTGHFPLGVFHLEERRSWGAIVLDSSCVIRNGDHLHAPMNSARFPRRGRSRPDKSHPLGGFDICAPVRLTVTGISSISNPPEPFCRLRPSDRYPLTRALVLPTASVWKEYGIPS